MNGAVRAATDSRAFELAARAGYSISGVLHLLIAYIIVRLPFGSAGNADQSGALATLAAQPGGAVALWLVAGGLVAMALWRVAEAILGSHPSEPGREHDGAYDVFERIKSGGLALIYAGIALAAVKFADGGGESSSERNAGLTARLLQTGWGKAILLIAAAVIIGIGGYHVYKGLSTKFEEDLTVSGGGPLITPLGIAGYTAKGVVLGGAGVLLVIATLTADPAKGAGLDAAVKSLGQPPFGKALLIAASVGFAAYGAYCFVLARFSRM
ncbi:membrane protein [Mycobacterium sp. EPa45]|nr:membrane protein [Mycobacterium sp. EPa45]